MSQQRFYIGGFDRSSTKEDLSKLFSKLVNVDYVHVPAATATGLDRNFAIVVATSTEEIAEKCVKSFNGSNWRGCKIRVELAKQYYQDRWRKEKELPAELIQKRIETVTPTVAMIDEAILKRMEKKQVVMKKSPCAPLTTLSMKPIKRVSHRNRLKALKIFFDEEGNAILSESPATSDESGSEDDESTEHIHESTNAVDRESSKGSTTESAKQKSDDKLVKTADFMGSNKILEGGGSRRGFGTLVADPIEKRVDCCIEQDGAKEFLSDDEDIIDTPCINSEDLSEDALAKERERALALFASLKSNVTKISSAHSVTVVSMDDANEEEDVLKTKGGYAQMDKLKNIFYKEGGVWWDDEDRRTNAASAVGKGAIVKDALFLEAEKLGIDIRDSYITTAGVDPTKGAPVIKEETNTNQLDSGALFNSSQPGNSVLFNFFPDTSDSATSNKQILDAASADDSAMDIISTAQISMQPVTITELIKFAASFSRDKPLDLVESTWRAEREKVVSDYKKKRKDAKRRLKKHTSAVEPEIAKSVSSKRTNKSWRGGTKNKKARVG